MTREGPAQRLLLSLARNGELKMRPDIRSIGIQYGRGELGLRRAWLRLVQMGRVSVTVKIHEVQ
jgi:hypothetical protein